MSSSLYDYLALEHGGWARLCDPDLTVGADVYTHFEAAGLDKETLDRIRFHEAMPAHDRMVLDIADELVRAWSRSICGFNLSFQPKAELERFVSLPLSSFWGSVQDDLRDFEITKEELELLIEWSILLDRVPDTSYRASRMHRVGHLARLCRKPFERGPDLQPSRVPLCPSPPTRETAVALAEPQRAIET